MHKQMLAPTALMRGIAFPLGALALGGLSACSVSDVMICVESLNNQIVFTSSRDDDNQDIWVISPDGSGLTRLTNDPWHSVAPAISPDGTKIAFTSQRTDPDRDPPGPGPPDIYVMNADGSSVVNLTGNVVKSIGIKAANVAPAWSPDGSKIAFASDRDSDVNVDIFVMNADGTKPVNLTNNPFHDNLPTWSADGTKIAFESSRDFDSSIEIYAMNADGTAPTRLTTRLASPGTNSGGSGQPAFSPNGTKIAFVTRVSAAFPGSTNEIWVMNADGSNPVSLSQYPANNDYPAWSPDGTRMVFTANALEDLFVMNADGSNPTNLTNHPGRYQRPAWSRDCPNK